MYYDSDVGHGLLKGVLIFLKKYQPLTAESVRSFVLQGQPFRLSVNKVFSPTANRDNEAPQNAVIIMTSSRDHCVGRGYDGVEFTYVASYCSR